MQAVRSGICDHQPPFTVLGAGRTSVKFKLQRVMWSLRLECESHRQLEEITRNTVALLRDAGTEKGLGRVKAMSAEAVLPFFDSGVKEAATVPEDGWHSGDDAMDASLSLTGCLSIDGPSHMIHNATLDLGKAMQSFDETVASMQHICRLLRRGNLQRLLSSCFSSAVGLQLREALSKFKGHVVVGRWGTIAAAVPELLALEGTLRFGWNLEKLGSQLLLITSDRCSNLGFESLF